jgi:hypothetical protein
VTDLADVRERLARIETGQDALKELVREALDDLRPRVAKVERRQWLHAGGVGVIAFVLAKLGIPVPK